VDQGVTILCPLAVPVLFPMLSLFLRLLDRFFMSPKPFDSCEAPPLGVIARECMFSMPRWFLDPSILFAQPFTYAVSTSYPALGMSMYMLDLSAWFPQPFGLSGRPLAALSGGVSVLFAILCTPVCTFDMSKWSPQLFGLSECRFALWQCTLSHHQLTFGESPLGKAQLGCSILLVVQ
ncbi:hypothetical protein SCLCIDRAFT_1215251, partial [Scleroderma citrinum Foug A]